MATTTPLLHHVPGHDRNRPPLSVGDTRDAALRWAAQRAILGKFIRVAELDARRTPGRYLVLSRLALDPDDDVRHYDLGRLARDLGVDRDDLDEDFARRFVRAVAALRRSLAATWGRKKGGARGVGARRRRAIAGAWCTSAAVGAPIVR